MEKMFRYRIYTEHINNHGVRDIVSHYFTGFTMYTGMGIWKKEHEANLTIEIITNSESALVDIEVICRVINQANRQECCLVTVEKVEMFFVGGKVQG